MIRLYGLLFIALIFTATCRALELRSTVFAATPVVSSDEMMSPRSVAVDSGAGLCYVLDHGLGRVVSFSLDGRPAAVWPLDPLGIEASAFPVDPLLPQPVLAIAGKTPCLLNLDRQRRQLDVVVVPEPEAGRTLILPEGAANAAVQLDSSGRVLIAYLRIRGSRLDLVIGREQTDGTIDIIAVLDDPCDTQVSNLFMTGFTVSPDGRVAIGIAQSGSEAYGFIRSWLVQGKLQKDSITTPFQTTHRFSLLDQHGKLLERYSAMPEVVHQANLTAKPCVPLFTSLQFGPHETIISGGHARDPFLRVYAQDGRLMRSTIHKAGGGQQVAVLADKAGPRIFLLSRASGRADEVSLDGRIVGGFGKPIAYDLAHPVAAASNSKSLYVIARWGAAYHLLRFDVDGQLLWTQILTPPAGLEKALPFLTVPNNDRVLVGWRLPDTAGLSWISTVMEDGMAGQPIWRGAAQAGVRSNAPCPTPLVTGDNGRVYALCATKNGATLFSLSLTGAPIQQFPPEVQGVTSVTKDGSLAWAYLNSQNMGINLYTPQGKSQGWKLVPRPAQQAQLLPANIDHFWGWLTSTHTLLQFNESMTVIKEATVLTPEGNVLERVHAICGDRAQRIYLAVPDRILMVEM